MAYDPSGKEVSGAPLAGLNALVTGASRGIGLGIARALLGDGARVMLCGTNDQTLEAATAGLAAPQDRIAWRAFDVADREAAIAAVDHARGLWGKLDILVNCAGIYKGAPFADHTPEDFRHLFEINVIGAVNLCQAALPTMVDQGFGRIINVASTAGKWGSLNQSAYNVSKHALVGLTRCLALEHARTGVTVNALCPGLVETDLVNTFWQTHAQINHATPEDVMAGALTRQPIGRLLTADEIGATAAFLARPIAGGMTGQSILHDGAMLLI